MVLTWSAAGAGRGTSCLSVVLAAARPLCVGRGVGAESEWRSRAAGRERVLAGVSVCVCVGGGGGLVRWRHDAEYGRARRARATTIGFGDYMVVDAERALLRGKEERVNGSGIGGGNVGVVEG